MLSASMASRRPLSVSGGLPKADLSERSSLSPAGGGPRWRANGTGQFVDSASTDWELSEELVKLQLGASTNDSDAQIRTPPQSKAAVVQVHETSPLETASEDSLDSNSSHAMDQPIAPSHSRGSSGDTSVSHVSAVSTNSQTLRATPFVSLKVGAVGESRNRPHSYSGGLSSSDLTRLQQAGSPNGSKGESWSPNGTPEKPSNAEQPTYPSLSSHQANARSQDYQQFTTRPDEFQVDYQAQQRQFNPLPQGSGNTPPTFVSGRPSNIATSIPYRQPPRAFNPQIQVPPVMPSPPSFGYPASLHPAAMPINNNQQQLYEMMLPTPPLENPAMARLQQQHGVFSRNHQHSASDPAPLRDPAAMALLNSNMQAFAASQMYGAAMPPPPPGALGMFTGQFYQPGAPQDAFASPELAAQMMARLQTPYPGQFGSPVPGQAIPVPSTPGSAGTATPNLNNGPSANNRKLGLYKTELCRSWEEKGSCRYGAKCQFAHGEEELRKVQRHPKYKTEICRTFWVSGSCPYGKRCCFIHTELPASGAPPGAEGVPPPTNPDGRARSASTNSDPNEPPSSLLARISAKRNQEGGMNSGSGSVSTTPPSNGFQINSGRPGSLRVDTSVLEANAVSKQNKSAYPTYAHNGILLPTGEEVTARSPGPVTAGPDFGRHASSRMDIVGSQRMGKASANPSVRHSFNGSDIQLDFSAATPTATNASAQYGISSPEQQKSSSRINGHVRSGSAGNWGSATGSRLTAYPLSSIPDGELKANYPWAEYSAGGSLLSSEKNWA